MTMSYHVDIEQEEDGRFLADRLEYDGGPRRPASVHLETLASVLLSAVPPWQSSWRRRAAEASRPLPQGFVEKKKARFDGELRANPRAGSSVGEPNRALSNIERVRISGWGALVTRAR